ncbi:MAG: transposase [Gammaproteobacteria bacterium]|nr:transposase [Gammaproteobacteria bacterium]
MARKHYSLEYREQIVALVKSGRSITSVAKEFGLADQTVRNWVKEGQEGPLGWRERERALRRENARLTEERDILAKATGFQARGDLR